ncbi:MAG: hypothetical protein ACLTJG_07855 [[Clostridium] innocuum]
MKEGYRFTEKAVTEVKDGSIDFHHVSFAYSADQRQIHEDIDLHIRSGETIGILEEQEAESLLCAADFRFMM